MRGKITKRTVERLQRGDIVSDTEVRGFVVRRLPSGAIQYGLRYRVRDTGQRRWLALGLHGNLTPEQARIQAKKAAGKVADRRDPLAEHHRLRRNAAQGQSVTEVLDEFVSKYVVANGLRSEREIRRIFEKYVKPAIGGMDIQNVLRSTVTDMLDHIDQNHGPVMADRVRAHLSKAFNWFEVRSDEFRSPIVRGMTRVKQRERSRTRILNEDEIRTLWQALEQLPALPSILVKVLVLTAQRRGEVGAMRWDEIADDLWTIPAEKYKTKKANVVPLSEEVRRLLNTLPRRGEYVFGRAGKTPFSGFSKLKKALDTKMKKRWKKDHDKPMETWVIHDLRRTSRSLLAACGVRSEIAERVLGHTIKGVEGVYDHYGYFDEKRDALERLAARLGQIVRSHPPNVVPLRQEGQAGRQTHQAPIIEARSS